MANNNKKITDTFSAELSKKLMSNLDIVSSEPSGFEEEIGKAVSGIEEARRVTETGIGASFERQRIEAEQAGEQRLTSAEESRRGFATNTAILKNIEQDTEKSLRDLDLREQEALASGRTEVASQLANLKIQQLQFRQQSRQQVFSNLLGLAQFQVSTEQAERQITVQEQSVAFNRLKTFSDIGVLNELTPDQVQSMASNLNIAPTIIEAMQTRVNEDIAGTFTNEVDGTATIVFRDKNTNKLRTEVIDIGTGEKATGETDAGTAAIVNSYVSQLLDGQIGFDEIGSVIKDEDLRNRVVITYNDILNPQPTNRLWVSRMLQMERNLGDGEETIRANFQDMGVPDIILNEFFAPQGAPFPEIPPEFIAKDSTEQPRTEEREGSIAPGVGDLSNSLFSEFGKFLQEKVTGKNE